jgi:hypothetical protein
MSSSPIFPEDGSRIQLSKLCNVYNFENGQGLKNNRTLSVAVNFFKRNKNVFATCPLSGVITNNQTR